MSVGTKPAVVWTRWTNLVHWKWADMMKRILDADRQPDPLRRAVELAVAYGKVSNALGGNVYWAAPASRYTKYAGLELRRRQFNRDLARATRAAKETKL